MDMAIQVIPLRPLVIVTLLLPFAVGHFVKRQSEALIFPCEYSEFRTTMDEICHNTPKEKRSSDPWNRRRPVEDLDYRYSRDVAHVMIIRRMRERATTRRHRRNMQSPARALHQQCCDRGCRRSELLAYCRYVR